MSLSQSELADLTVAIIESDPDPSAVPTNLIGLALAMAEQLNEEQRFVIAAFMRSEADRLVTPRWN
jgi:hypothetical protein